MIHPTFKDQTGREWIVSVSMADVATIREACNVDIRELNDIARLDLDSELLVRALWLRCQRQAELFGITTPEEFGAMFSDGDVLDAAADALQEAIQNFSGRNVAR